MAPRRAAFACAAAALLSACSDGGPAPASQATNDPLSALPPCATAPAGVDEDVDGLLLPDAAVTTQVTRQDPLVNVSGYVAMTPEALQLSYADRDDIEVLLSENEIFEAELLISDGDHRNFIKATATCQQGSQVLVVVAPEVDAAGLPVPQGAGAPPPPP